ncbi:nitronate monooxygenase family protein [Pleionea sp. CnH1-48]|uniref:NAD(P)H-dependent flavin oxidoreductase n=1 Tax=Pleionea sp. CnH1-48 TaxID=2954494 RepID=UPI0020972DE8|nr:nitronate monooxygenase [Pleionea sp. CnH1-48]MCO7224741.1 nitronate monooxygenase [Pleionea sp. CnH1-48]
MWNINALSHTLGIQYPVIQGPFGGGLSSIQLLKTVSDAGGLGSYGAHILSPDKLHTLVHQVRQTTQHPFAINLWVSDHDEGGLGMQQEDFERYLQLFRPFYEALNITPPTYVSQYTERFEEQVEALIEAAPPVFSFVFGIPHQDILESCRRKGITTIGTATTLDEALALDHAGVDAIVATGFEAGGHRVSFMKEAEDSLHGTMALVPQIVDRVKAPVIAAGGIADPRGVKAAFSLGAQGVQIGTAFLACDESGTDAFHREALFSDAVHHTVLSRAFTGRLARFIPNFFVNNIEESPHLPLPFPMQSFFTGPIKHASSQQSNPGYTSHYAGQGAPLIKHRKALDLFNEIIEQMQSFSR